MKILADSMRRLETALASSQSATADRVAEIQAAHDKEKAWIVEDFQKQMNINLDALERDRIKVCVCECTYVMIDDRTVRS